MDTLCTGIQVVSWGKQLIWETRYLQTRINVNPNDEVHVGCVLEKDLFP